MESTGDRKIIDIFDERDNGKYENENEEYVKEDDVAELNEMEVQLKN